MQSINALSLTPYAKAWLAKSCQLRVLHVFDNACNLINERREVLSVVTEEIGDGPFNLVIPGHRNLFVRVNELDDSRQISGVFANLNLQSLISNSHNHLSLGDLTIHTDDARLWSPRPHWEILHARRDDILSPLTKSLITHFQSSVSNLQFANSLPSSFANADLPASLIATKQLAGLGSGLTPAGDDFILGAVLAAWIIHPSEVASALAKEITEVAAALTTSLSGAWLRSAGRGEAGILWHQFFESLHTGNLFSIQLQITKLLAVGHTSGADALSGFVGTLRYWVESKGDPTSKVT